MLLSKELFKNDLPYPVQLSSSNFTSQLYLTVLKVKFINGKIKQLNA